MLNIRGKFIMLTANCKWSPWILWLS